MLRERLTATDSTMTLGLCLGSWPEGNDWHGTHSFG